MSPLLAIMMLAAAEGGEGSSADDAMIMMARAHAAQICNCHFLNGHTVESCEQDRFYFFSADLAGATDPLLSGPAGAETLSIKDAHGNILASALHQTVGERELGCSVR